MERAVSGFGGVRVVARAKTLDGVRLILWESGVVTTTQMFAVTSERPLSPAIDPEADLWAGWRVFAELSLLSFDEVGEALKSARVMAREMIGDGLASGDWWRALSLRSMECEVPAI